VKWSAVLVALVPSGVVTVTSTTPAVDVAGDVAVIDVPLAVVLAVTVVAGTPPKSTAVAPVNPVPVSVTDVPPAMEPVAGEIPVTTGATGVVFDAVVKCRTAPGYHVPPTLVHAA
jgi:hypothetical protein